MVSQSNGDLPNKLHPRCGARGEKCVYVFVPQPDITAHELALSLELLFFGIGVCMNASPPQACDIVYGNMEEGARRHWRVQKISEIAVAKKPSGLHLPPGVG